MIIMQLSRCSDRDVGVERNGVCGTGGEVVGKGTNACLSAAAWPWRAHQSQRPGRRASTRASS